MRTFICGDIHGCLEELQELLRLSEYKQGADRFISVGDLVDKGPDSAGVVRLAREKGFEVVMGNHEEKHIRWRLRVHEETTRGKKNQMHPLGEEKMLIQAQIPEEDWQWLGTLPYYIKAKDHARHPWMVVHAGFDLKKIHQSTFRLPGDMENISDRKAMLRVRHVDERGHFAAMTSDFKQEPGTVRWPTVWPGPECVLYGHAVYSLDKPTGSATPEVERYEKLGVYAITVDNPAHNVTTIGIDTGCCYGGYLTAAVLHSDKDEVDFIQVKAKQRYKKREGGEDE